MNHIDEGLLILRGIKAPLEARLAFCIHPIVQNDEPIDVTWSKAYFLAQEYRDIANRYLCKPETDHILTLNSVKLQVGRMSKGCAQMLFADKLQNQRDFLKYHQDHPRAEHLHRYFALWIAHLTPLIAAESL